MKPKQFALLIRVIAQGFQSVVTAIVLSHNYTKGNETPISSGECDVYYYHESEVDEANAEGETP